MINQDSSRDHPIKSIFKNQYASRGDTPYNKMASPQRHIPLSKYVPYDDGN